jgi:hypothetical protein
MVFGDINCDSLNDAIATIEYYTGGNRPEFTKLYVELTSDGYKVKAGLPLFGYRYVSVNSIENCVLELNGKAWTNDDPMCCPSIDVNFKVKLVGDKFELVNENTQPLAGDANMAEFEKAKQVADSIKQKYEGGISSLLKISYAEINEGKTSWVCYFDSLFKMKYFERHVRYDENVETSTYEFHMPEGIILWYQVDQQGSNSNITIWLKQHIYQKLFDTEKNTFNYSSKEGEVDNPFVFKDQKVANKLITTESNTQVQVAVKLIEIPKEEFSYESDSSCYRLTVQKGEKGEFDSFWSELRVDSALFVHLFGDK